MKSRRIFAMTGTRADYGIYRPVFRALCETETMSLGLMVTGMHLSPAFGHTVDSIRKDGFPIVCEIDSLGNDDSPPGQAAFIARTLVACADLFQNDRPDILLVLGDRGEQLAAAIAAVEAGIPVAHLHGGEESGGIDNAVRHAITQLSSLHLASTEEYAARIRQMIGTDKNVHAVGAPALDVIRSLPPVSREELCASEGFDTSLPLVVLVQHPDTLCGHAREELQPTLDALASYSGNMLILGANADTGGRHFNVLLQHFAASDARRHFHISIPHEQYLQWLSHADVLVGNSSSGIIEAASFHTPVINIGNRQRDRAQSGNVINVSADRDAIGIALQTALHDASFQKQVRTCVNIYGDGQSAARITRLLSEFPLG